MGEKLEKLIEKIRDSEAYQQLKSKYDELDSQTKLYVNLGALGGVAFLVFLSLVAGMARLASLKSEINDREETIGYLQRASDTIQEYKRSKPAGADLSMPLPSFVQSTLMGSGMDAQKADIGAERPGAQTKETVEMLLDVKLTQVNLTQLQQFLFALSDKGAERGVIVKDLDVDTKGDPSGWMDATVTLSSYKAK